MSTANQMQPPRSRPITRAPAALLLAFLMAGFAGTPAGAVFAPYTVDSATLHLWHLDETATPCVDSAPGGTNLTYMINGATLGNASFSNNAVNFTNSISFGTLATPGAVIFPAGSGNVGTAIPFTYAGTNGAFTYEALVHVEFNPTNNYAARNQPFQIMDCDADNAGTRVFQFRLDPVGVCRGWPGHKCCRHRIHQRNHDHRRGADSDQRAGRDCFQRLVSRGRDLQRHRGHHEQPAFLLDACWIPPAPTPIAFTEPT